MSNNFGYAFELNRTRILFLYGNQVHNEGIHQTQFSAPFFTYTGIALRKRKLKSKSHETAK